MSAVERSTTEMVEDHVARLSRGELEGYGEDANRILNRINRGESIDQLQPLFAATSLECTKSLVFILSELGLRSIEAMEWLETLLDHPDEFVRHYAVVAVQHSGSLEHGRVVAKAIATISDARPVSLAAVRFLAMGSLREVATAVPFLNGDLRDAVTWLVSEDFTEWERFSSRGGVAALVAVAAVFRNRVDGAAEPLERLTHDGRADVADAARFVATLQPLPERGRGILRRIAGEGDGLRS